MSDKTVMEDVKSLFLEMNELEHSEEPYAHAKFGISSQSNFRCKSRIAKKSISRKIL